MRLFNVSIQTEPADLCHVTWIRSFQLIKIPHIVPLIPWLSTLDRAFVQNRSSILRLPDNRTCLPVIDETRLNTIVYSSFIYSDGI